MDALRPYRAMLVSHFQLMLQYRAAALAGFATQCWWGAMKVMILAAFYVGQAGAAPMPLHDAIDYVWLGQALLALLPWSGDGQVAEAVRTGAVAYERLRPADTYTLWFARAAGGMIARVLPRAALMVAVAGVALPLLGLQAWSLRLPSGFEAGGLFAVSLAAAVLLSASIRTLLSIVVVATLNDRGPNTLAMPIVNIMSGSIVPLAFFPDGVAQALRLLPLAGVVDIPFRIYLGELTGTAALGGIGLQLGWTAIIAFAGRAWLESAMARLQVQGG
jgi:ABC-2 type transport system permease protein